MALLRSNGSPGCFDSGLQVVTVRAMGTKEKQRSGFKCRYAYILIKKKANKAKN